jgi:hypothetical protein
MKKSIATLILFLSTMSLSAQTKEELFKLFDEIPRDKNGEISYTLIDSIKSTKEALYFNAKSYIVDNFKSANDVIQLDDKDNFTIIGKGSTKTTIKVISGMLPFYFDYYLNYNLRIQSKENRYKIDIYNIVVKNYTEYGEITYTYQDGCNKSLFENDYKTKSMQKAAIKHRYPIYEYANQYFIDILYSIKDYMHKSIKENENW